MNGKIKLGLLLMGVASILMACSNNETVITKTVTQTVDQDGNIVSTEEVVETKTNEPTNVVDNSNTNSDSSATQDTNKVKNLGATIPSIDVFTDAENYPKTYYPDDKSRNVSNILTADGGWRIVGYEDNHNIFITQDNHNPDATTTKHGLLIYDEEEYRDYGTPIWTNYYFKGVYLNEKTNKLEFKFVVDSKARGKAITVGMKNLKIDDVEVNQDNISFNPYSVVKEHEVQLFTVEVELTDDLSASIYSLAFELDIFYNGEDFAEGDDIDLSDPTNDIFMILTR